MCAMPPSRPMRSDCWCSSDWSASRPTGSGSTPASWCSSRSRCCCGWAAWWQMMVDWLPFQAVLVAYDYSRGYASPYSDAQVHAKTYPITDVQNDLGLPLHVHFPIVFDQWLGRLLGGDGMMPTTWVQEHFHPGTSIPLIGVFVSLVYCSHFLVMPTVAVVLWIRNRPRFLIWMRMVIVLAVAGVATYFLYPMAPPWLADSGGCVPRPARGTLHVRGLRPDRARPRRRSPPDGPDRRSRGWPARAARARGSRRSGPGQVSRHGRPRSPVPRRTAPPPRPRATARRW